MRPRFVISKSNTLLTFMTFWGFWYVFFNASIVLRPMYLILWPALVAASLIFGMKYMSNNSRAIQNILVSYIPFFIVCVLSYFVSLNSAASADYIFRISLAFIFSIAITSFPNSGTFIFKIMAVFAVIMLICSFCQYLAPGFYTNNILSLCSESNSILVVSSIRTNQAVGLTNGTSQNGLYLSLGFVIFLCKALCSKRKAVFNVLMAVVFFGMIFATGKRSYSLISIVVFLVAILLANMDRNIVKRIFIATSLLLVLYIGFSLLATKIPVLNNVIEKFSIESSKGDVSNGRFELFSIAWNTFKSNLFTGIGIDTAQTVIGGATHNSYLQWMAELGIIMVIPAFGAIFGVPVLRINRITSFIKAIPDYETKFVCMCSLTMMIMILLSGLVAIPFQWPSVFEVYMMMQMLIVKHMVSGGKFV